MGICFISMTTFAQERYLDKVLDGGNFRDNFNNKIIINSIIIPSRSTENPHEKCRLSKIYQELNTWLSKNKAVVLVGKKIEGKTIFVEDILIKKKSLVTTLLSQGLAYSKTASEKYYEIIREAKIQKRGVWSHCHSPSPNYRIPNSRSRKKFRENFPLLSSGSYATKVRRVLSGNAFVIHDNIVVNLLGVEVPSNNTLSPAYHCFSEASRKFLQQKILNRTVWLFPDNRYPDDSKVIYRWASLLYDPQDRLLNQIIIDKGFGRFNRRQAGHQLYEQKGINLEYNAYREGRGAWGSCLADILATENLQHEKQCHVKGKIQRKKGLTTQYYYLPSYSYYRAIKPDFCFLTEKKAREEKFSRKF